MVKFDIKVFALSILFSLILITILSVTLSTYTDIPVLKTGPAFILIMGGIYVTLIFSVAHDFKFDKNEVWLLIFVALALFGLIWSTKHFFPEIFSALPSPTKELFSSVLP